MIESYIGNLSLWLGIWKNRRQGYIIWIQSLEVGSDSFQQEWRVVISYECRISVRLGVVRMGCSALSVADE